MLDYVAWLPDGVQWQPYGPFAEPRRVQICGFPGFAGSNDWTHRSRGFF